MKRVSRQAVRRGAITRLGAIALAAAVLLSNQSSEAQKPTAKDLDSAIDRIAEDNKKLAEAQTKIGAASDEAESMIDRYRGVRRRTEALVSYNDQLEEELLDSQREEVDSLREQIDQVTVVSRQILPLMTRMLEALEDFVELDVPFLMEERKNRVADLRKMMSRADVEESEKYRRLMEAYQVENEYGRTIEAYRGSVDIGGAERNVDFLRVGRVALIYRTVDGQEAGRWDQKARKWESLPREYLTTLPKALRIARKQAAPDLIRLPVTAPEDAK